MTSREIRQSFLDFFVKKQHRIVPSAPVIPHGDPTLLFTNAGMNQFKDVFLGIGKRDFTRCADTQKCIRVSGKHNDLEEVGYDTYHHTFFEMLGNWSFGDYYKAEAIAWSWELLTDVWKLPKDRLHATVFRTDDEAFEIWKQYLPESQIHRFDEKDNFWEMGETGPCGPCSEIHFDRSPKGDCGHLVNAGVPEVIEIWNNVFIQYNRKIDGSLEELTSKHVDTGMGFERICSVIQGKTSNYETDVFMPIIEKIEQLSGRKYSGELTDKDGVAMRVMADHIRTLTFAIADGAMPGNEGRGYVLRRILRRAARYSRNLGFREPVLFKLVQILADSMGDIFPEIVRQQSLVERVVKAEEESFLATLENGLNRFEEAALRSETQEISGADAFLLYDTFGFPLDLTELIARERGFRVDSNGFLKLMDEQKIRSRAARKAHIQEVELPVVEGVATVFTGYDELETEAKVLFVKDNQIVLDKSPFYVESGGQVADTGTITLGAEKYEVLDVRKSGSAIIHLCEGEVEQLVGDIAKASVDKVRRANILGNHSVTHLLHESLRRVLGSHVQQAGSLVTPSVLRFDFPHFQKISHEEISVIEQMVNSKIRENIQVETLELNIEEARKMPNVKMFFGDKYGDKVRVVIIDEKFSAEFCGGTHVKNSSEIGLFKITSESSIAAGVRRLEAVTGWGVMNYMLDLQEKITKEHKNADNLHDRIRELEKELAKMQLSELSGGIADVVRTKSKNIGDIRVVADRVAATDLEQLKSLGDELRNELGTKGIGLLGCVIDDKAQLVCVVTDDTKDKFPAGKLVGLAAKLLGGGGGGKPHLATAGGKEIGKLDEVLANFAELVAEFGK